ncbi:hypothetical protein MICAC_840010 [Microcystis aeruginosa PCC 9443]|uniref:Uncharacterized protein n=1 Tax=Microcystis aeruginosa PCC 9443 TaxID=1160281 RepID=I4GBK8_MICAE|nr:hypothetical protein MICAC_840010 [Microcystis aeruginosa PCC 9443]
MPPRRRGGWGGGGLGRLTISAITYEKWYDYLKIGKTPHPTPHTPHPASTNKLFQQLLY